MRLRLCSIALVALLASAMLLAQNPPAPSQPKAPQGHATPSGIKSQKGGVVILSDTQGVDFSD